MAFFPPDGAAFLLEGTIDITEASRTLLPILANRAPPLEDTLDWLHFAYTTDRKGDYVAPAFMVLAWSTVSEGDPPFQALRNHLLRRYPVSYVPVPATIKLDPSSYFYTIGWAPEYGDWDVEKEGESRGGNLDNFNFSLGYQTKLVGQTTNPSGISLINLGADPHSPSGIRGDTYRPSHTDACLTGPLGYQTLVPRKLSPYQEDHNFLEEEWVVNHPLTRHERAK